MVALHVVDQLSIMVGRLEVFFWLQKSTIEKPLERVQVDSEHPRSRHGRT
jgi:hypothetical protein